MRSSIADYEVLEKLESAEGSPQRYLCRPPGRLDWDGPVEVMELSADPALLHHLSDQAARVAGAGDQGLRVLLEVGPDPAGSGAYLSCEAATGGTIAQPTADGQPAPSAIAAVAAIARGAHALHEVGLAHGSICPEAVLLTARGPVLSVARLDGPAGFVTDASSWERLSTVDPDLLRGESPSRSSDIWSLGATLHRTLTQRPLYQGIDSDPPVTAVQRIMFTRPEPDPSLDDALRELVHSCMATDPAERPRTASDLAERLSGLEKRR